MTPKDSEIETVKKILVGGIYIAPCSKFKQNTIDHIIETMFYVHSRYAFPIHHFVSGDFNKVDISDVLETNGSLNQICSVPTRNSTILELIITDMATMFHPPTTLDPLKQDKNSKGKPSDHNVIIAAPKANLGFKIKRHKKKIKIRSMPQ